MSTSYQDSMQTPDRDGLQESTSGCAEPESRNRIVEKRESTWSGKGVEDGIEDDGNDGKMLPWPWAKVLRWVGELSSCISSLDVQIMVKAAGWSAEGYHGSKPQTVWHSGASWPMPLSTSILLVKPLSSHRKPGIEGCNLDVASLDQRELVFADPMKTSRVVAIKESGLRLEEITVGLVGLAFNEVLKPQKGVILQPSDGWNQNRDEGDGGVMSSGVWSPMGLRWDERDFPAPRRLRNSWFRLLGAKPHARDRSVEDGCWNGLLNWTIPRGDERPRKSGPKEKEATGREVSGGDNEGRKGGIEDGEFTHIYPNTAPLIPQDQDPRSWCRQSIASEGGQIVFHRSQRSKTATLDGLEGVFPANHSLESGSSPQNAQRFLDQASRIGFSWEGTMRSNSNILLVYNPPPQGDGSMDLDDSTK
ncbi:uncharacterized protein BDZ83DRAFT_652813 [Colletotrichum acutatum]|uniref:Uncharacterized protein n=1 Tax=Glomerella acutata TaxID=27357 RepID=A0AAD8UNX8_GLOAC|nr:uncharacterized protein BDZ83DRAFT_652813 [Colletotrichum acutatum]KAK1723745.1 hypothetical protein BDZ83DRAFT_652813 [Colletotrichum acutatum]